MSDMFANGSRSSVRRLVVLMSALSMLVFAAFASSAQASEWNVETSKGVTQTLASLGGSETIAVSMPSGSSFKFGWTTSGLNAELSCAAVSGTGVAIYSGGTGKGTFTFSKCTVNTKSALNGCTGSTPVKTKELEFEMIEVEGKKYLEFTRASGILASFTVEGECNFGGERYTLGSEIRGPVNSFGMVPLSAGKPTVVQAFEGLKGEPKPFFLEYVGWGGGYGNIGGGPLQMTLSGKYASKPWF